MKRLGSFYIFSTAVLVFATQLSAASPEAQTEADWHDDRWNRMVPGRFEASTVPLSSGLVLKGLSIAVGANRERTVCYDTQTSELKAFWSDGFLVHNSRRFGVVNGSAPAGVPVELFAESANGASAATQWKGLQLHGERVVLRYSVGGREILESPWWESVGKGGALTRHFVVSPGANETVIPLQGGFIEEPSMTSGKGRVIYVVNGPETGHVLVLGGDAAKARIRGNAGETQIELAIQAAESESVFWLALVKKVDWDARSEADSERLDRGGNIRNLLKPGPKVWPQLETKGSLSRRPEAYTIDTLDVPYKNPWNALMFLSGIDFLPNGDAAVCTLYGDVWLVKGIDSSLKRLEWHRYATGLFQPLGLQVIDGVVYVLGRDQITALHDLNEDGFADDYRNHSNLIKTQPGHKFVTSLQAADDGSLFYCDPLGVHQVSPDGDSHETIATGWRNPNGMGLSSDGILTVAPQQGAWTPSSQISEVRAGGYYGFGGPQVTTSRPMGYDPPLCWIPHNIDNSGGSQVWAAKSGWGPLSGQMIHLSFGRCAMMLVLRDVVDGVPQGGVSPMRGKFLSGAMRGAVNPKDGQLYVVGTMGWQTSALRDGSLQRVRYTGKPMRVPIDLKVHKNGVHLRFAEPLDPEWASNSANYAVEQWNYQYSKAYGSKDFSVENPESEGRDSVPVLGVELASDQRSVFVSLGNVEPVMQMSLRYNLRSVENDRVRGAVYHTVNKPRPAYGSGASAGSGLRK